VPDYNESRARHEYEKANLAELVRLEKEALLLPRGEVERAWADSVTIAKTKLLAVPTRAKQRIPHLTLEEIEILTMLQREALEELSSEG
jgi:phage terminase Nu1 subunit (DNA packaging protein)